MPISPIENCNADHWVEVKEIICDSLDQIADFTVETRLVSDADDMGVIQRRIVQNVYSADIIICDVSAKNPNVMFELGLRLAFDKPTVIIKDDKTEYSFDTAIIEHLNYPRDLRFKSIQTFKALLAQKVISTFVASQNGDHSTFLKNFGTFHVAKLSDEPLSLDKAVLASMEELRAEMRAMRRSFPRSTFLPRGGSIEKNTRSNGVEKLRIEILKMKTSYPNLKLESILTDDVLITQLEESVNAGLYFNNRDELKEAVVRVLVEENLL